MLCGTLSVIYGHYFPVCADIPDGARATRGRTPVIVGVGERPEERRREILLNIGELTLREKSTSTNNSMTILSFSPHTLDNQTINQTTLVNRIFPSTTGWIS